MDDIQSLVLSESRDSFEIDGLESHRRTLTHMLSQSRRSVDVVSRHLDRRLFDQTEVVENLRRMALTNRRARVRLLIIDTGPVIRTEHRLMTLAKRLPTFFEVRGPGPDHRKYNTAFVVADGAGCIYRPHAELYDGEACFNDPVRAGDLTRQFDKMWESGAQDVNLRQMRI